MKLTKLQLDITDDDFLSLMDDDTGATKDDVKIPDGEVGDKIKKLFQEESKDVSMLNSEYPNCDPNLTNF